MGAFSKIGLSLGLLAGGCATAEERPEIHVVKPTSSYKRAFADQQHLLGNCRPELLRIVTDCEKFGKGCEVAFPNSTDADPVLLQQLSARVRIECGATLESQAIKDSMFQYGQGINSENNTDPCPHSGDEVGQCKR